MFYFFGKGPSTVLECTLEMKKNTCFTWERHDIYSGLAGVVEYTSSLQAKDACSQVERGSPLVVPGGRTNSSGHGMFNTISKRKKKTLQFGPF